MENKCKHQMGKAPITGMQLSQVSHVKYLKDCLLQFATEYYQRYVNDIFLLLEETHHVKKLLHYMNSHYSNIKFTFQEENDNKIHFLIFW